MPIYRAQCLTEAGTSFAANIEAASVAALRQSLEAKRSFLISYREVKTSTSAERIKLPQKVLIQLYNLLSIQLDNGVHTDTAIARLRDEFPDRQARTVLGSIYQLLSSSRASLSEAMSHFPRTFPPTVIAAIKVGEEGGAKAVADRFVDLRDQLTFRLRIKKTAQKALAYPAFIMCAATGVVSLLLIKLIPMLQELLTALNVQLPPLTRAVLAVSAFARAYWPVILVTVVLLFTAWKILRRVPATALAIDRFILRVPLLSPIFKALVTADVAKTYRSLYAAGQDAGNTLTACANVVNNRALKGALHRARELLENGTLTDGNPDAQAITEALRSTGYFPSLALTIISTGEASGGLIRSLDTVANYYAEEAQERISIFFSIFDKVIMVCLIVTVGCIIVGVWQPIMTAAQNFR